MDELLSTNWGDIVGAVGFVVTFIGFGVAIYQATKARKAADAAEAASQETRQVITQSLTIADLQRAIALIQRLKILHREGKWEGSLEHYQSLRAMLGDINSRHPKPTPELRLVLLGAREQIKIMEDKVDRAVRSRTEPTGAPRFNEVLNTVQLNLEALASSAFPGSESGE